MRNRSALLIAALLAVPIMASAQPADLMIAARAGDLESAKALLMAGAEPDPPGIATPLYFAAQGRHIELVQLLLDHGADPNIVSNWGTPLHIAARRGHADIVMALLRGGADPNLPGGEKNKTPLHEAAEGGSIEAAALLVDYGADVNVRDSWDHPPAHSAAQKERTEMLSFLQRNGAAPRAVAQLDPGDLAKADVETGRVAAEICRGCHAMAAGDASPGRYPAPNLANILERQKASLANFPYSAAMKKMHGVWTAEEINQFIADPTGVVPGTHMGHAGVADAPTRTAIIAFLAALSTD